ncbi:MAG: Polysaccharide biosynthesis/export protein [Planctomycetes bacterium ADurb.Bin412]|nr:MAG: Polysaccharide biosynthesis/export protein [Planctomycetes bacterium ADurb.Bin412]
MKPARMLQMLSLLVVLAGLSGCFSSSPKDIEAFVKPYQQDVTAEQYVLQPPDEIEIHAVKIPEINLQRQRIRPDGRVAFENLGVFKVAGQTPEMVADMLQEKAVSLYSLKGEDPIEVRVTVFKSQVYYVVGEVRKYGPKVFTGRDTALTAIAEAIPEVTGWTDRIQVVRPSPDPAVKPKIFEIKYKDMLERGDSSKNVLLQEGDIIYVPPTPLAALAMVIAEFVRPIGQALSPVSQVYYLQQIGGE